MPSLRNVAANGRGSLQQSTARATLDVNLIMSPKENISLSIAKHHYVALVSARMHVKLRLRYHQATEGLTVTKKECYEDCNARAGVANAYPIIVELTIDHLFDDALKSSV